MKFVNENTMEIKVTWKLAHKIALLAYVVFALSTFLMSLTGGCVDKIMLHIASAGFLLLAGTLPFCIITKRKDAEFFGSLCAVLAGYFTVVISYI